MIRLRIVKSRKMSNVPDDWVNIAVDGIVGDLSGRKGLGDIFNNLDDDIMDEICDAMAEIILESYEFSVGIRVNDG
jgi:hypothetical protein